MNELSKLELALSKLDSVEQPYIYIERNEPQMRDSKGSEFFDQGTELFQL